MNARRLAGILLLSVLGCSKPQPKAPEQIAEAAARKPEKPGVIDRLDIPEWKKAKARPIARRVGAAFAEYDRTRLLLLDEAISQIRAGEIERSRLEPLADDTIAAFELAVPALVEGLNEVHALLSPEERRALVELYGGKDENQTEEERQQAREERISKVLDLTSNQKTRLYAVWLKLAVTHLGLLTQFQRNVKDARARFVEDDFDARTLPLITEFRFHDLLELAYEGLNSGIPILSVEQRSALAAYMDAHMRD